MSTKSIDHRIKKFKNIITINPYINKYYEYRNQELENIEKLHYGDSNFVISYVTNKDMIIASLDLGFEAGDDELDDVIYMKAYEELGLDQEQEYSIHYQKNGSAEFENIYNVFITEPEVMDKKLTPIVNETKYIDLLLPAPLLYRTLYTNHTLETDGVHCYIYFTMHDAFVTIYRNGEFLYSKSIEYSLHQIYEKYCIQLGEKVDEVLFFEMLESEGLKSTNSLYQQNLMKLFSEVFLQINDILIYTKRAYNIPNIQKLFLGSVKSPIIGLGDYGHNYLGIPTFNLDFTFDIKNDEWYVDQLHYLMVKSGLDYLQSPDKILNLSTYPRPPIFAKRASGQFIISTVTASLLAIGIPLAYLIPSYMNEAYNVKLNSDNIDLSSEADKYKQILSEKQQVLKKHTDKLHELENIFENKAKTLTSIYNKKVTYTLKSGLFYTFAQDLKIYDVKINELNSTNDNFTLSLLSNDDKKITKYIKYISKEYFEKIKEINIERIELNKANTVYNGILKVNYK